MKTLWDDDDDIGEAPPPLSLLPLQLVIHSTQSIIICRRPSSIEKAADTEGTKWCKGGGKEGALSNYSEKLQRISVSVSKSAFAVLCLCRPPVCEATTQQRMG